MNRNIEMRLDKLEDAVKPKTEMMKYSPEEKILLKEIAKREAITEMECLHGKITNEEKEELSGQIMTKVAEEMGLEQVLKNLMERVCHE